MIYIFDIDGTLANIDHRLHFIKQDKPDWRSFYAASDGDEPIPEVVTIARCLDSEGGFIVLITGRSTECEAKTRYWLKKHSIPFDLLYMRREGDHRQDAVIKSELLDKYITEFGPTRIDGVFEDRQQCVDMYRAKGIRVFQVAKGDF